MELKLRNGGLGGIDDFDAWNVRLDTATSVETVVSFSC